MVLQNTKKCVTKYKELDLVVEWQIQCMWTELYLQKAFANIIPALVQ